MSTRPKDGYFDGLISVIDHDGKGNTRSKHAALLSRSPSVMSPEVWTDDQRNFYSAPELVDELHNYPEVYAYDRPDLELNDLVHKGGFGEKELHGSGSHNTLSVEHRLSKRFKQVLLVLTAVIVIVLGVGLGVGLTRHSYAIPQDPIVQNATSQGSSPIVLTETSLSATITSEDNRHVFYQSTHGDVLHSQFVVNSDTWLHNNLTEIMSSNSARNGTPFASILASGLADRTSTTASLNQSIILLYVDTADSLTALSYQPGGHVSGNLFNTSLPVKKDSRTVKMTPLPLASNFTTEAILAYESESNGFRILHAYYYTNTSIAQGNSGYQPIWQYKDITESILEAQYQVNTTTNITLPSTATIFDCSYIGGYPNPGLLIGYLGLNSSSAASSIDLPPLGVGDFRQWENGIFPLSAALDFDSTIVSSKSLPGLGTGDTAILTWKNGGEGMNGTYTTEPVWIDEDKLYNFSPTLDVDFLYSRFAWTASNTSNTLYIYNQANGTALVESQFVDGIQWQSQYILLSVP